MRVVAGTMRGRKLFSPAKLNLRATSDKVKEALFNIIAFKIEGASFLDLYAGSGSIGIEAISRGAKKVVFIEKDKKNMALLKKNLTLCPQREVGTVFEGTAEDFLKRTNNQFNIAFIDPPYGESDLENRLQTLGNCDTIRSEGIVIVEHFHKTNLPNDVGDLSFLKRYRYGGTALSFYVKK